MKLKIHWLLLIMTCIFISCKKENSSSVTQWTNNIEALYQHNAAKITITQGIAGTLTMRTGNCMPVIGQGSDCKEFPVKRTLFIYNYTTKNQTTTNQAGFFTQINTTLVTRVNADDEGFYQVTLAPGNYSVFIYEKGNWYANSYDGQGGINPVTVLANTTSKTNQYIDYAVY